MTLYIEDILDLIPCKNKLYVSYKFYKNDSIRYRKIIMEDVSILHPYITRLTCNKDIIK